MLDTFKTHFNIIAAELEEANGREYQLMIAYEELSELEQAFTKLFRYGISDEKYLENFKEEVTDVLLTCEYVARIKNSNYYINFDRIYTDNLVNYYLGRRERKEYIKDFLLIIIDAKRTIMKLIDAEKNKYTNNITSVLAVIENLLEIIYDNRWFSFISIDDIYRYRELKMERYK